MRCGAHRLKACATFALVASSLLGQPSHFSDDVVPRKQTVQLTIDPSRDTFEGSVSI